MRFAAWLLAAMVCLLVFAGPAGGQSTVEGKSTHEGADVGLAHRAAEAAAAQETSASGSDVALVQRAAEAAGASEAPANGSDVALGQRAAGELYSTATELARAADAADGTASGDGLAPLLYVLIGAAGGVALGVGSLFGLRSYRIRHHHGVA